MSAYPRGHDSRLTGSPPAQSMARRPLLLGVRCRAREVKGHARFVAHDPRIVSRWNIERVVGADIHFRAIGHDHMHAPGEAIAGMLRLAAVRLGDWLDAF